MVFMISSFGETEYCFIMSAKRNLPAWMVASDHKRDTREQIKGSLKSKPEINTNKCVRKKCTKRMIYWMNEKELVETALCVLKDHGETAAADRCAPLNTEVTVVPETDPEETTDSDVSEPAVDIAEEETVPYGNCQEEISRASEGSGEQRLAEKKAESEESDSDHEALQVVRDIFFS